MAQGGGSSSGSVTVLKARNGVVTNGCMANGFTKTTTPVTTKPTRPTTTTPTTTTTTTTQQRLQSYQRVVFISLFVGYACYTYNRKSVSYATPTLLATGLVTTNTVGVISSCQNMAYAVSKFLGGVLSDRVSARLLFSLGLALSGSSAVLFAHTEASWAWCALWAVNGLAQGCGWPSCAKMLKKWFSPNNFGTYWSILTASSNLSGTVSPLLAAYVIMHHGWAASLLIAGLVSLLMAAVTLVTLVDDPSQVNLPNPSKTNQHSDKQKELKEEKEEEKASVGTLLSSPFLWVVSVCYLCVFLAKTAISEWGQFYLISELGRSAMEASSFTSAMETGGFFGGILAGVLTDRVASRVQVEANVRLLVASVFMFACWGGLYSLTYILTPYTSQVAVSGVGALLGASMFGPISIYGIVASESFPAHLSGTAHAVVALAANVGAVLAGWPLSKVARAWSWSGVFVLLQVLTAGSALVILLSKRCHITKKLKKD